MTRQSVTQPQTPTTHPLSGGILQRKCNSCGQHAMGGECGACEKGRSHSQRGKVVNQSRLHKDFSRISVRSANLPTIQAKPTIGQPGDKYEQEADRVVKQIMRMPALSHTSSPVSSQAAPPRIQRLCSKCEDELRRQPMVVQAKASDPPALTPTVQSRIQLLRGSGKPLPQSVRNFFEPRFGRDFSQVRIQTDASSTQALNALAYTVGSNIVFGSGQYAPDTSPGKRLLAHELTHVVQQNGASSITAAAPVVVNAEATAPMISRADPDAVSRVLRVGNVMGSGIQFWPTNVTDTRVGPVSVQGGLLSNRASQLNVIIGENLTLHTLARQILPLWTTATPFTPPGATAPLPLDSLDEKQLAQGLLVYNQTFLPVPAMTNWRSGLRFPLPVEIDETTGVATLHPTQIRQLASAFNPVWERFLYVHAGATTVPSAATLQSDVAEFLRQETTVLSRGIHLGARALTNAVAELPFIRETFVQLGNDAFEVALAFMDNLVNREIELLAAQQDGAAILAEIGTALAAAPTSLPVEQQVRLDRANQMIGRVADVRAIAPPAAIPSRASELVWRPSINGPPCACLVFIHNNERNARRVAEDLYQRCRYNLASIERGRSRGIPILGRRSGTIDPNELFPQDIQAECTQNESGCREYVLNHSNLRAMRMQFFLAIKDCSNNFALPTVALHNNTIGDTTSFRRAIPRMGSRIEGLRGNIDRGIESGRGSLENLRNQLQTLVRGRNFRGLLTTSGTTNIFRWCNLPEIGRCHIGDPARPDHVIWTTNPEDYAEFEQANVNVVLQTTSGPESGESATDLSTLFLRLGSGTRFINIETPGTPRDDTTIESATQFVSDNLSRVELNCCDS